MKKRIYALLLILVVLSSLPLSVSALDLPDPTRTDCSLEVKVWDKVNKKPITDGNLLCVRVGAVVVEDGNACFRDLESGKVIEDVLSSGAPSRYYDQFKKSPGSYTAYKPADVDKKEGIYSFQNLKTGLYLVIQTTVPKGYYALSPFLVTIPYNMDGEYEYHLSIEAKSELEKEADATEPARKPGGSTGSSGSGGKKKLPQTGQLNWPVPVMTIAGLTLFIFGWYLCFGRKKDIYED